MNNRLTKLFQSGKKDILSIYFTSGYPSLNDTVTIIETLEKSGVDFIEIGMPFSDPLADGPVIQESSMSAINNGMSIPVLFDQIAQIRKTVSIPLILMGYFNPVFQYGIEKFIKKAAEIGIDGVILPDLPLQEYLDDYQRIFESHNLSNVFLITPQTSQSRIQLIDKHTNGFIYMVSSSSTTGTKTSEDGGQTSYFERIKSMPLKNPTVIGFGIKDHASFKNACRFASGAIIGSAFVKAVTGSTNVAKSTADFVHQVLKN